MTETLSSELESIKLDCQQPGWDGYGAEPVSARALDAAEHFLRSLPAELPQPEVSADPDVCVTFEWRKSPCCTLLVSVGPGSSLDFAALIDEAKTHGSRPFFGLLPEILKTLIRE